jgi:S-adenosylmethionine decarboxylase proenzyme
MKVKHLNAKLENCRIDKNLFSDESFVKKVFDEIVKKLNMTFIDKLSFKFNPHGLSMLYLIAESHIAIHTWPEHKLIDLEIVTCKEDANAIEGLNVAMNYFKPEKVETNYWEYTYEEK